MKPAADILPTCLRSLTRMQLTGRSSSENTGRVFDLKTSRIVFSGISSSSGSAFASIHGIRAALDLTRTETSDPRIAVYLPARCMSGRSPRQLTYCFVSLLSPVTAFFTPLAAFFTA